MIGRLSRSEMRVAVIDARRFVALPTPDNSCQGKCLALEKRGQTSAQIAVQLYGTGDDSMLSEEDVIEVVCDCLKERGYEIEQQLGPAEHGYDIIAKKVAPLGTVSMYVEAKGATSSSPASNCFGQEFNASQVRTHISVAMYKACEVLSLLTEGTDTIQSGIALPNDKNHVKAVDKIRSSLAKLGIYLFLVNNDRTVLCYPELN